MNNKRIEFTDEQHNAIVDAIRAGIEDTKHHAKLTSRVEDAIKKRIKAALGDDAYVILYDDRLVVWNNTVSHDERFTSYLKAGVNFKGEPTVKHWSERILFDLDRVDTRDIQERRRLEEATLTEAFQSCDKAIAELNRRIESLREAAIEQIKELPVPKAATRRTDPIHWNHPTTGFAAKFPNLFPKKS